MTEVTVFLIGRTYRLKWLALGLFILSFVVTGCSQSEGAVAVGLGEVPQAASYRLDLYADEDGLPLVDGRSTESGSTTVTWDGVRAGRWSLLVQAEDAQHATIAHCIVKLQVKTDATTQVSADAFVPGPPDGSNPGGAQTSIESFGPEGRALLTALYAPGTEGEKVNARLRVGGEAVLDGSKEGPAAGIDPDQVPKQTLKASSAGPLTASSRCATAWLATRSPDTEHQVFFQTGDDELAPVDYASFAPGETAKFFVATTFQTVECARILDDSATTHCLIFAQVKDGAPVLDEARALEIAQAFDVENPFQGGGSGIYADTRARFGSEWNTNPVGGRDGNSRVLLVFLGSQEIGGEGFFGFFRPQDEYPKSDIPTSNQAEVLFLNADRARDDLYNALDTIAHEFSHLIIWNQKVGQNGRFPEQAASENITLDEGLAVLNEELSGFGYEGDGGGNGFLLAAVDKLLQEGMNRPFFKFRGGLGDYGAGYLFWRYLHDRFGLDKVKAIVTEPGVGQENVAKVLGQPFTSLFLEFGQSIALNGEDGIPPGLDLTDLDLHGTYVDRSGKVYELAGLQGKGLVSLPQGHEENLSLEPWGMAFFTAHGGDGGPLVMALDGLGPLFVQIQTLTNSEAP